MIVRLALLLSFCFLITEGTEDKDSKRKREDSKEPEEILIRKCQKVHFKLSPNDTSDMIGTFLGTNTEDITQHKVSIGGKVYVVNDNQITKWASSQENRLENEYNRIQALDAETKDPNPSLDIIQPALEVDRLVQHESHEQQNAISFTQNGPRLKLPVNLIDLVSPTLMNNGNENIQGLIDPIDDLFHDVPQNQQNAELIDNLFDDIPQNQQNTQAFDDFFDFPNENVEEVQNQNRYYEPRLVSFVISPEVRRNFIRHYILAGEEVTNPIQRDASQIQTENTTNADATQISNTKTHGEPDQPNLNAITDPGPNEEQNETTQQILRVKNVVETQSSLTDTASDQENFKIIRK